MKNFLKLTTLILLVCCCWVSLSAQPSFPCEDCLNEPFEFVCVLDDDGEIFPFPNACFAECEGYTSNDFVECEGYTSDDFTECDNNPWGNDCDCDFEFEPVCVDVNGEILPFPNACLAECEGFTDFVDCDSITFPGNPCPDCDDEPIEPICVETAPGIICPFPNLCYAECEGYTIDQVVDCDNDPWGNDCNCD